MKIKLFFLPIVAIGVILYVRLKYDASLYGIDLFFTMVLAYLSLLIGVGGLIIDFILDFLKDKHNKADNNLVINGWLFCFIFLPYIFLSFILFVFSSGGWYGFFILFLSIILFGFLLLLSSILFFLKKVKKIFVNKKALLIFLILLFLLQSLTILLNYGDCGDSPAPGSLFVSRLVFGYDGCTSYIGDKSNLNIIIFFESLRYYEIVAVFSYFALLYYFSFLVFRNNKLDS